MFTEELTAIRKAEQQADDIKKSARIEAKRMLEAAAAQAERLGEEQESAAREIYDALIAQGLREAEAEYDAAIAEARSQADDMARAAEKNRARAIDFIVERIVGPGDDN